MKLYSFVVVMLLTVSVKSQAEMPPQNQAVHKAVARSVEWLESDMVTWRKEHGCSACHHGPMYLWSINVAKRQGYAVNEPQLRETTEWLLTNDGARLFPKAEVTATILAKSNDAADRMTAAMMGHNNLSQPTLYLAHALNSLPDSDPLKEVGWKKTARHFAEAQMNDGSFVGRRGWPPIFNTPQIHTLFAATAMQDRLQSLRRLSNGTADQNEPLIAVFAQANRYLDQQQHDETHQGLVLQLLRQTQTTHGATSSEERRRKLIERLRRLQRADGGWSQTDDRSSDALASGQTLYVLKVAGLDATDVAIRQGIEFLVKTQQVDGTWMMTSRPNPETGQPADFLNPITYAATAWATLGLTSHVRH